MRARAASLPLSPPSSSSLSSSAAAGARAAPARNASSSSSSSSWEEVAGDGDGGGGCPAACDCERDPRSWAWSPREESSSASCGRRRSRASPPGDTELRHLDFSGNQSDASGDGQSAASGWSGSRTSDSSANALVRVEAGASRGSARSERSSSARNHSTESPADLAAAAPRLWFSSSAGNPLASPDGRAFLVAPASQVSDSSACKSSAFPDEASGEDNASQESVVANNSIAHLRVHRSARSRRLDASDNRVRHLSADDSAGAPALRSSALDGNPLGAQEPSVSPGGASSRASSVSRCGSRSSPASSVRASSASEESTLDDNASEEVPAAASDASPRSRRSSARRNRSRSPPRVRHAASRASDLSGNAPSQVPAAAAAWSAAPASRASHSARCGSRESRPEASAGGAPQSRDSHLEHNASRGLDAGSVAASPRLRAVDSRGNPSRCDAASRPSWSAADARHVRVNATCLEPPGDWDMSRYVGDAGATTPAAPGDRNQPSQEATWPDDAETLPVTDGGEDDDDDDSTEESVRYGVRWGPVSGGFSSVVTSVSSSRKWLDYMNTKRFQYATKSKEYVYESEEDEDTTTTMLTDAGSPCVSPLASPLSPPPPPAPAPAPATAPGKTRFAVVPAVVGPTP